MVHSRLYIASHSRYQRDRTETYTLTEHRDPLRGAALRDRLAGRLVVAHLHLGGRARALDFRRFDSIGSSIIIIIVIIIIIITFSKGWVSPELSICFQHLDF